MGDGNLRSRSDGDFYIWRFQNSLAFELTGPSGSLINVDTATPLNIHVFLTRLLGNLATLGGLKR